MVGSTSVRCLRVSADRQHHEDMPEGLSGAVSEPRKVGRMRRKVYVPRPEGAITAESTAKPSEPRKVIIDARRVGRTYPELPLANMSGDFLNTTTTPPFSAVADLTSPLASEAMNPSTSAGARAATPALTRPGWTSTTTYSDGTGMAENDRPLALSALIAELCAGWGVLGSLLPTGLAESPSRIGLIW